ncbi:CDP-diacylglycerol--glycerol-3-phosphate 3-phosphatidyltransferase [Candidatus Dependentiae bacterium]|nr:CDP-diacylglycerol--glycerol-3-phosphate 3-phosphatidyltransferase [Candidatus Dependentiae bacterium]
MNIYTPLHIPLILTLIRLISSPLVLPFLFFYLLPLGIFWINSCLAGFFLCLSLTDFFDGYLARRYNQETKFGRLLDPIADKFLIYSTLISLVAAGKLYFYWAILFIGREFFVMALREISLAHHFTLTVSSNAKIKTGFQVAALTWVILNPLEQAGLQAFWWHTIEYVLLSIALFFSLFSAVQYYRIFIKNIRTFL